MSTVNIYQRINEVTSHIEDHLEDDIDYDLIAKKLGTNLYTARKIFQLLVGDTISDYVRKRRLSEASYDLQKGLKVIDIALKYHYESPEAFSRAFKRYHCANPSQVSTNVTLKNYPRVILPEKSIKTVSQEYRIIRKPRFMLYGFTTPTTKEDIAKTAPVFFTTISDRFNSQCGHPPYGMVSYDNNRNNCKTYSVMYTTPMPGSHQVTFPESNWLAFEISSQRASAIQKQSKNFYLEFLPSCKYNLRKLPELEYYHDGITDFLVAIEEV